MDSTEKDCAIPRLPSRAPVFLAQSTDNDAYSASVWVLIATAVLTAGALAYALCGSLSPASQPLARPWLMWAMALLRASTSIALSAAAGAADVWILWHMLSTKPVLR